jgi:phospholipid/cholesterol/gamma-HCH transport system ATP-binding protein
MKTAIDFQNTVKHLHGSPAVLIDDLRIYDKECVAFYGLTEEIADVITNEITGAYSPETGNVFLYGKDTRQIPDSSWFALLDSVGIYGSDSHFQENASIGENIAKLFRIQDETIEEPHLSSLVLKLANLVQLTITDLSKTMGEASRMLRMKAKLARTLAFRPQLVIFNDSTEEMPNEVSKKLIDLLRRSKRKLKYTLVLFTSDVRLLQALADRALFLNPVTGLIVENQLRGWYHTLLPWLQPSPTKLLELARDILQYGGMKRTVKS